MTSNTSHPMSLCHPVSLSSYSPLLSDVFHDPVLTPLNVLFARASHVLFCVRARMYKCTCVCASHPVFLHTLERVRLKTRTISDHNAQRIQGSFAEYVWIFSRIYRALVWNRCFLAEYVSKIYGSFARTCSTQQKPHFARVVLLGVPFLAPNQPQRIWNRPLCLGKTHVVFSGFGVQCLVPPTRVCRAPWQNM